MVRIKHRYLLIDILHPEPSQIHNKSGASSIPAHLYFHPPTPDILTSSVLARLLRDTISELFGDYGMGKLGGASSGNLIIKYLSPATSTAIIRCPRAAYRLVWAALTYLNAIPAPATGASAKKSEMTMRNAVFRVVRVSGTMRKAEEEAIRRARREIGRARKENDGVFEGLFGGRDGGAAAVVGDDEAVFGMDIDDDDDEESDDED
ncbi:uncharacterized protein BHQ10_005514 [Talaromyces amestolkiae]|uniref:Uncharacterized protein n=1 Tax=Talaromyces amestolkiae TaxID=1196081 RepID=A0A364L114_TALAM|nr:uncharacterized protein BHQ10_005514 [Talaromyces amestolkiae]RAO69502.1 hypothetical protein BHQ10_005514 [Talaromyces amestolkiae]